MRRTIFLDGMHCIYDKDFNINQELLNIVNSFEENKILVVNGFREKGHKVLGEKFKAFSLEEEGIKKSNPEYFKRLMSKFNLKPKNCVYFDHSEENVKSAESLGIKSFHYKNNNQQIKQFLENQ